MKHRENKKDPSIMNRRNFIKTAGLVTGLAMLPNMNCASGTYSDNEIKTRNSRLRNIRNWAIQLQGYTKGWDALLKSDYDMFIIDNIRTVKGSQGHDMEKSVLDLKYSPGKPKERIVLSYISIGEASDFRYYWNQDWKPETVNWTLGIDPAGWKGSYPVKYWENQWKDITFDYLDKIIADGFDGIMMDWVEAYSITKVIEAAKILHIDPMLEMIRFIGQIAEYTQAKKPGFEIVALNGSSLYFSEDYLATIDAILQEHVWFNGDIRAGIMGDLKTSDEHASRTIEKLRRFQQADIPVFNVEYAQDPKNVKTIHELSEKFGFRPYVTTLLLDQLSKTPSP